jgi:hypothetical protein
MGMTVMDAEQGRKLQLMRDSAMAHPLRGGCLRRKDSAKHRITGRIRRLANCAAFARTSA